jgi:hypothetical protein
MAKSKQFIIKWIHPKYDLKANEIQYAYSAQIYRKVPG